jgi:hypothetical protein
MIGDSFEINGNKYTIKKELKLGEYRKITKINSRLNKLSKSITDDITNEQSAEFSEASNDQLQVICDFLESHLGLNENDLDELGMAESVKVFQKAFEMSTTPDKELKKTSD